MFVFLEVLNELLAPLHDSVFRFRNMLSFLFELLILILQSLMLGDQQLRHPIDDCFLLRELLAAGTELVVYDPVLIVHMSLSFK